MRLIDADKLSECICVNDCLNCKNYCRFRRCTDILMCKDVQELIDASEIVDAEPVRHGEWDCLTYLLRCNRCNCIVDSRGNDFEFKFCPNCGAKMDGAE